MRPTLVLCVPSAGGVARSAGVGFGFVRLRYPHLRFSLQLHFQAPQEQGLFPFDNPLILSSC